MREMTMSTAETPQNIKANAPLSELVASVRYLVDESGLKTDVVLPLASWEELLVWLEDLEDRAMVRAWLPQLKEGPSASGALRCDASGLVAGG
jgi:hypothetical protein